MNVKMHVGVHPEGRVSVSIQASRKCFKIICVTFDQATGRGVSSDKSDAADHARFSVAGPANWLAHAFAAACSQVRPEHSAAQNRG